MTRNILGRGWSFPVATDVHGNISMSGDEKSIEEEESKLDWNKIKQVATGELGMQKKEEISIELNKTDSVETQNTYIKEQNESFIEKIIEYFINK